MQCTELTAMESMVDGVKSQDAVLAQSKDGERVRMKLLKQLFTAKGDYLKHV